VAAPSLGQDAALSFVVIGRDQRAEGGGLCRWRLEERPFDRLRP
jgi:hypothetical protein